MKQWQNIISSGMVGGYGAKRGFQPRRVSGESLKKLNQKVPRWQLKAFTLLMNERGLVLDHTHFATAVNLFSYSAEQMSSERGLH